MAEVGRNICGICPDLHLRKNTGCLLDNGLMGNSLGAGLRSLKGNMMVARVAAEEMIKVVTV